MCPRAKLRPPSRPAKLWILLVGVNQYQDSQNLASLQYSALDCQGLGEALKEATASFANKEVIIHHDFVSQPPKLAAVQQSIQHIIKSAGKKDTILFYFSGHGVVEMTTQEVALCLADTDTQDLLTTGLPLNSLLKQLTSCAASQQLVWLDACHSGGMTLRGTASVDPSYQLVEVLRHQAAESKGFYALLSCDQTQQSWEFPELGHGVFTYYLMRGLRGEAADSQGEIEADALYQYVYHQTLRYIDKTNQQIRLINQQKSSRGESKLQSEFPLQTPKRIVEGFGKVILGKRTTVSPETNPRQALVVDGGFKTSGTTLALSQVLQGAGDFNLRYFPQTNEPWTEVKNAIASCLSACTEDNTAISTALLYLRGEVEVTDTGESVLVLPDGIRLSRFWLKKLLQDSAATQQIVILDCLGDDSLGDWIEDLPVELDCGQCLITANAPLGYTPQFADIVLATLRNVDLQAGLPVAAWISKLGMALVETEIVLEVWLSGTKGVIELLPGKNRPQELRSKLDLGICPYRGLQAFDEASSEYFYGRESLVQKLINQIHHQTSIAVVGASGSGKSSVVQAGLIAKLRQGKQIPNSDRWWVGCFRPGSRPVEALARLLADSAKRQVQVQQELQLEGLLYQGVEGFIQWLRTRVEPVVVLVIDQFEELFTLASDAERQELLQLVLGGLKYASDRFKLVLTIRADFVAVCLENPELAEILQQNSVLVPPYLSEVDYRHAITKPASQVGLQVESGLVEVLLQDLDRSAGDLPLLQFALQQLWSKRDHGQLTLRAYRELGGVKGALERQAQSVYDHLDPELQDCARWIFLNLTQLGDGTEDTRRRITKSDLIVAKYPQAVVERTIRILTNAKLLVINLDRGDHAGYSRSVANPPEDDQLFLAAMSQEVTVEVVHEILIRHWSSLRWWLEENRSRLRSQRQIEQAASLWWQQGKQNDFLLQGVRLGEAEEIYIQYTDELSSTAKEFIASCLDERLAAQQAAKKHLRQAQLSAITLGVLGLAATFFGIGVYRQQLITQVEHIHSLTSVAEAELLSNQQLESLTSSVKAAYKFKQIKGWGKVLVGQDNWQQAKDKATATLQQSIYGTQEINRLEGHSQKVTGVSVSNDGQIYATASDDGTVRVWQQDGTLIKTITESKTQIMPLVLNFDGSQQEIINPIFRSPVTSITTAKYTYTIADNDGIVQLKSLVDNQLVAYYNHKTSVTNLSISDDENLLATTTIDGQIHIWSQEGILQQTLVGHNGAVTDIKFIPRQQNNNRYQLISTGVDKTIRIWQVFNHAQDQPQEIASVAVSPVTSNLYAHTNPDNTIDIWSTSLTSQHKKNFTLSGHNKTISQIKYSPDGKLIATTGWDKIIKLWNTQTGELVNTLQGHQAAVNTITFSSNGKTIIAGTEDNKIYLWDIQNQPKIIKSFTAHTDSIKTVTVSNDHQIIASGGYDNKVKLWTIQGKLLQTIPAHNLAITSLEFTPDGKILASASWDNTVKIWSIQDTGKNHKLLHTLKGHQAGVTSISINSQGTVLASGSGDRTIKLWHLTTGELIKNIRGHTSQINSLAFSKDDQSIISGEAQQGLFWWNLNLDHLLTKGCDQLTNYLTTNPYVKSQDQKLCQ